MAVTANSIITPQTLNQKGTTFTSADTTVAKTIFTPGANGAQIRGISAWSNDSAAINLVLSVLISAVSYRLATIRIPALTGSDGAVVSVSLLNTTACPWMTVDAAGNPVLNLVAGAVLQAAPLVTMTGAKSLELYARGEDF